MGPSSRRPQPGPACAAPASALRMCLALLGALVLSAGGAASVSETSAVASGEILDARHARNQQPQRQTQQHLSIVSRSLEELRHSDGTCHESVLSSPLPASASSYTMGVVFVVNNTGAADVDISGVGVYLDPATSPQLDFDYSVHYSVDPYVTYNPLGTAIISTTLGGPLEGDADWVDGPGAWRELISAENATVNSFSKDDTDGTSYLSFGSVVTVPAGGTRSIYMKFSEYLVAVEDMGDGDAEAPDALAVADAGYAGVGTQIGRKDIISGVWVNVPLGTALNEFFPSARFLGKLWTGLETCSPTGAPTTAEPSLSPTPPPTTPPPTDAPSKAPTPAPSKSPTPAPITVVTVTILNNSFTLSFAPSRRRTTRAKAQQSRSLQDDCLTPDEVAFAEARLEAHANAMYQENLPPSTTVTFIDIRVTGHTDISAAGDCTEIEFTYDQEMGYQTDGSDEITEGDLVELPLKGDNAGTFVDDLVEESNGGKFSNAQAASGVTITADLSTRAPTSSPSVSAMPSYPPSVSPTWSPSETPSASAQPSTSAVPSSPPSVAPTTTFPPTLTKAPSPAPSTSPTSSSMPTGDPSAHPSMQPSVSAAPSYSPSVAPSDAPSLFPSVAPSYVPTTLLNFVDVEYTFDVAYPPEEEATVMAEVAQNVTRGIDKVSDGTLYLLTRSYGVRIAGDSTIVKDEDAIAECEVDTAPENANKVCSRFVVTVPFKHERGVTGGIARSWLLEVSNEIAVEVTAVYAGNDSARTYQIATFENVLEEPKNVDAICSVIREKLEGKPALAAYKLLAVVCQGYTYEPLIFKRDRGLRRRLEAGDLVVQFEVHAEYTPAKRGEEEDVRDGEFAELVEDSINRDQGKELSNTLREREIIAMQDDGRVQTAERITEKPTRAPTDNAAPLSAPADESSSNTTGIAIIVVCSVVALLGAGFFLYKGLYAGKKIEDDPDFESYDYSSVEYDKPKHTMAELLPGNGGVEVRQEEPRQDIVYAAGETNIFGDAVGASGTSNAKDSRDWQDEKVDLHEGITRSEQTNANRRSANRRGDKNSGNHGRDQLDAFESRVRQKGEPDSANAMARGESQRKLSAFDARLQRKVSGSSSRRQDPPNESISTLESFEERVLKKSGGGKPSIEHQASLQRLEDFDERLQKKLERSGGQRGRSPGRSAQEAFDERVRRKAASGSGGNKAGASRGSSGGSAASFDERLKTKLSRSRSRSVDSQGSGNSFEDRLKVKLSKSSTDRTGALASTPSSRRLDDLEARIRAKSRDEGKSRSRSRSVDSQGSGNSFEDRLKRKLSGSSTDRLGALAPTPSSRRLDDLEARIRAKSRDEDKSRSRESSPGAQDMSRRVSHGSVASFEDRLEEKLRKSSSSRGALASSTSSRNLDDFEARIAAKSREGSANGRPLRATSSSEDFEARLAAKTRGESSRSRGTSPRSAPSYEDRLKMKLNERARSSGAASSSSSSQVLDDLEARITTKNEEGNRERSLANSMPGAHSSSSRHIDAFDARIAAKTKEGGEGRAHNQSLGAQSSSSALDSFNARIEAKSREGGNGPVGHNREAAKDRFRSAFQRARAINTMKDLGGHSEERIRARVEHNERLSKQLQGNRTESSSSLHDFEEKIRKKSAEGNSSRGTSSGPSSTYEDRLKQKLAQGNSETSRSRPAMSLSATPSARSLNDFEARVAAKAKEEDGSRERARSSLAASTSSSSSRVLDDLEARIAAKNKAENKGGGMSSRTSSSSLASFEAKLNQKLQRNAGTRNGSPSQSPAASQLDSYEARIQKKNEGASRSRSSLSSSQGSALSSFESKLEQKLASSNAKKSESASGTASSRSSQRNESASGMSFEERLAKKRAEKKKMDKK